MVSVPEAVPQDPIRRYSNVNVAFHWITVALVITQALLGFAFHRWTDGPVSDQLFTWHKTVGATILLITLARLAYRLSNPPPPYSPDLPEWERIVGTWNHRLFYLLLIALPLAGLTVVSAEEEGAFTELAFGIPLPVIPGVTESIAGIAETIHIYGAYLLIATILIHASAGLKHQFIDRIPAAGRMPPFQPPRDIPVVIGQGSHGRPVDEDRARRPA